MTYRYRFISEHRAVYGVKRLCRLLGVRRQGFYEHLAGEPARARRAQADDELAAEIAGIHVAHRKAYGARRVAVQLRRDGRRVNRKKVERIMRQRGIVGLTRRRRRSLTRADRGAAPAPDLLCRDFSAERPGEVFVGDITYLPTAQGWLYLATVIDLCTREVVGYAMAEHMRADLVCETIEVAVARGLTGPGAVFHSDKGSQYTSAQLRATLARAQLRPSTGRTGSCYDNAVAESWFATLKTEIGTQVWTDRTVARQDVLQYLIYYNRHRLHSTLGYRTPYEARIGYRHSLTLVA
ncbi:IS3 family transposase [Allorhizocola rhizosphaerae]|uniref:IS3 family transposase n=1 Tax=Allorhizocola rhizosphaerae TaxID=1872709 RepID=UPI000E3B85EC|nr:IS3 family transposase [Allorhizocola rhizosphaerae]